MTDKQLAAVRNRRVGLVFQAHHLLPQCTALENVLIPTVVVPDAKLRLAAADRAIDLLQRVGMAEHMHREPGRLSIGQCQRVAFVRALINRPKLLLADEPTGSLDRAAADELGAVLVELNRLENVTLIVVTHSLPLASRLDRHLELRDGRLLPGEEQS
jgi:ABC-type lipoprotein export system ATPase subunit